MLSCALRAPCTPSILTHVLAPPIPHSRTKPSTHHHRCAQDGTCVNTSQYGVLAGVGFTLTFGLATLVAGRLTDALDRRFLHTGAILVWSLATSAHGICKSFNCILVREKRGEGGGGINYPPVVLRASVRPSACPVVLVFFFFPIDHMQRFCILLVLFQSIRHFFFFLLLVFVTIVCYNYITGIT